MTAILPILIKEYRHIMRDQRSLAAAILLPVLMLVLFGYAISLDVKFVTLAVIDRDGTPASRRLLADLTADGTVRIVARPDNEKELEDLMDRSVARIGIVIPPGYHRDISRGISAPVQVLVDGTEASFAGQSLGQMVASVRHTSIRRLQEQVRQMGSREPLPTLTATPRVFYNEPLDSRWFVVPGLIAIILMQLASLLTSQCIAREYEHNTIEQILVSPLSGPAFMMGKLVPYVGLGIIQVTLVTVLASSLFHVPIRGSLNLLALGTLLYLTTAMLLGMFLSAALKSQQVAMQVSIIVTMLPSFLLSGFIFPIENMPSWLRVFSYIVPARYYIGVTRGLFLKGVGFDLLWPDFLAMTVFALVLFIATFSRFRSTLT